MVTEWKRIQYECGKIRTRIIPNADTLHARFHMRKDASSCNSTQLYTTKINHNFPCQFLCYLILSFLFLFFLLIFLAKWNNFINFVEIRVNTEFLWKFGNFLFSEKCQFLIISLSIAFLHYFRIYLKLREVLSACFSIIWMV